MDIKVLVCSFLLPHGQIPPSDGLTNAEKLGSKLFFDPGNLQQCQNLNPNFISSGPEQVLQLTLLERPLLLLLLLLQRLIVTR